MGNFFHDDFLVTFSLKKDNVIDTNLIYLQSDPPYFNLATFAPNSISI